jgi:hypothetical protein
MGIRKALLPLIPSPILRQYRKIKRHFVSRNKKYAGTGTNILTRTVPLDEAIIGQKKADSVKVIRYLAWENPFNFCDYRKYQYQESRYELGDNATIDIEFTNYGLWTLEIKYYRGEKAVAKEIKIVKIEAPEYNIAYLSATLPVEIFLINLWDITSEKCPSIVGLERVLFDYKALPRNVYPFPLAEEEELNTAYKGFYGYAQRMVSYISMLYQMNQETKIHLYLCDHQAYFSLAFLYANRIPEKNFTVHMLSDGTGSYEGFNYIFGNREAERIYNAMKATWALSKQEAGRTGVQRWRKETFIKCGEPSVSQTQKSDCQMIELSNRLAYAYVLARENSNFEWILHNPELLDVGDRTHFPLFESIRKIDFAAGIKNLEKHREELIKLLGIDYSVFERSYASGKKICMLFGSYPPAEADIQYVDATTKRFGNEYDYYFKEHPRTVVSPEREKELMTRGVYFLDPKIPSELYMMINPDICLAGYLSSTFLSIGLLKNPEEQILSIWGIESRRIKTNCLNFTAKTAMDIENETVVVYD